MCHFDHQCSYYEMIEARLQFELTTGLFTAGEASTRKIVFHRRTASSMVALSTRGRAPTSWGLVGEVRYSVINVENFIE